MDLKKGIFTVAIGLALVTPAVTLAAGLTSAQVSAVINLLQSFNVDAKTLVVVQAVLDGSGSTASTTAWTGTTSTSTDSWEQGHLPPGQNAKMACIALTRNLGIGSQGDDVKSLQEMLAEDPEDGFHASSTGYFGPLTAHAMALYQMQNGIASSTTGYVGPLTRGFFSRHCGEGLGGGDKHQPEQQQPEHSDSESASSTQSHGDN